MIWNQLLCVLFLLGSIGSGNTQRKQGRNIAVGSDGKTPANFDCPEEFGYYPHPTDCTQYYVCVFGGALLESCTGGLMYSHELQTCDWPRNVGCDGLDTVSVSSPGGDVRVSVQPAVRTPVREERVRYTVVPTAQPQPVVSSRGQSRQLHATVHETVHERQRHPSQDIISKRTKLQQQQQQQLYADADDVLPPAEEIENDRQQRVYRGQPSTVGQVQRDRDGLRHTNAIPSSNRGDKIGVISFGTQQQQPVQQYRNDSFYIDNSLTDDLTAKRRQKRQTRRRLAPLDLLATADSSISWTRHIPHVTYQQQIQQQQQQQQQPKTYQNHRLQPSQQQFKPFSAILSGDQTEFQPFSPNVPYKTQSVIKPNPYVLPKIEKPAGLYTYFKTDPRSQFPQEQNENYAYFNLGGVTSTPPPNTVFAPSNQAKTTQAYYQQSPNQQQIRPNLLNQPHQQSIQSYQQSVQPHQQLIQPHQQSVQSYQQPVQPHQQSRQTNQPVQNQNQYRAIVNTPGPSQIEYVNNHNYNHNHNHKQVPENQENNEDDQEEQPLPLNHKGDEDEDEQDEEEEEEEQNEKTEQSPEIKPEFPSPPPFFFKSTNKYENIANPFADPNFDFDKFISKIKQGQENQSNQKQLSKEAKLQMIVSQNDSKQKLVHSKIAPHIDLRTPVAFSTSSNKKKVTPKPILDEEYYYDDDVEEMYEKPKKPYVKHDEIPIKTTSTTKVYSPINKNYNHNHSPSSSFHHLNKKNSLPVTVRSEDKKPKPSRDKDNDEKNKPEDDDYEYYDDYDYDEDEKEEPQIKKPLTNTSPKPVNIKINPPKITNPSINTYKSRPANYETVIYQNKSQTSPSSKSTKYVEKHKENRPSPSPATESTHKITTINFPNRTTTRLTTTVRPRDKDPTTKKTNPKNSSRLEENVSTQSHSIGTQSTPSGRTLYNGSQHYDPAQYDPYYTLYEDDVELYRDVDYTQQQPQYTSNRAQPQQVYRGTPAPISVPVQSTVQEETVPQRNTAYYSTQPQDVYSAAHDYQEDNYNTQVDDQSSYRQSSRQPSRGDRNELIYFVESTPKSTTTIRTTTTTTTTTPRPIPVHKQNVVPSRLPIIAANQTRPQSIIITLSATPGQLPVNQSQNTTNTTTETKNDTDSLIPKPSSRFISLSTGFNLRQTAAKSDPTDINTDNANSNPAKSDFTRSDPTPSTYKPQFIQTSTSNPSTKDLVDVGTTANRPAPFSLTKLPNDKMKSVVFRLSSRLSSLSQNVSETENLPPILRSRLGENQNKREIVQEKFFPSVAHLKTTDSAHVVPTTYSPSKAVLAFLPKHTDNESVESSEERLVAILPKKIVIVSSGKINPEFSGSQRKSVTVENPITNRTNDKPIKTIIRKLPIKIDSTTSSPSPFTERAKERRIISKIHFGIPQTYTSPEKINNLATTPSSFSSTTEFEDYSAETSEKSFRRPVSAHYITTDLTTTQRPHFSFSNSDSTTDHANPIKYSTTEKSVNAEDIHDEEIYNQRPHFRFSTPVSTTDGVIPVKSSTTEKSVDVRNVYNIKETHNSRPHFKFSTPVSTTELNNPIKSSTTEESVISENVNSKEKNSQRPYFRFSTPVSTTEQANPIKHSYSTSEKSFSAENDHNEEINNKRPHFRFSTSVSTTERANTLKNTHSTTEKNIESIPSIEEIHSQRPRTRYTFNSKPSYTTERGNSVKYTPNTFDSEYIDSIENTNSKTNSRISFNYNLNPTTDRRNYNKYTSSTTEKSASTEITNSEEIFPSNDKPQQRFSFNNNFNPTTERKIVKFIFSTTETPSSTENSNSDEVSSINEKPQSQYAFNSNFNPNAERKNYVKVVSATEKSSYVENTDNQEEFSSNDEPQTSFSFNNNFNPNVERKNYIKIISTTEKASSTEDTNSQEDISSNEKSLPRFSSNFNPSVDRKIAKYTLSTTEKPSSTKNTNTDEEFASSERSQSRFAFNSNFNSPVERKIGKYYPSTTEKHSSLEYIDSANDFSSERPHARYTFKSTTERENYFKYSSSSTDVSSRVENEETISSSSKPYNRFVYNSNSASTTEKSAENNNTVVVRKPIFKFVYNPGPTTSTDHPKKISSTTKKDIDNEPKLSITSTIAYTSTKPFSTTTERPTISTTPSTTTSTTLTSTTSTSTTAKTGLNLDRATEKYRFVESSEISDTEDKVRSQLFINRNAKPFRATAELPTVSEILATENEQQKKEIDNLPTYKPKPLTETKFSRNVTLPARLSRVNTAIKSLTAFGGTRRNSQSLKCNENQTTPDTKCNEIQKQRTSTRGRGSAHYTSAGAGDSLAVNVNRGTPATPRSRPTLKPSTSIVSKAQEYVDIYRYPPHRPDPIYPQPQVDKTAAKCRKDVCLLPDCNCGGREIPGDLPVEQVPQIVLITFDDSVNDLNKGLYSDLFEKGRTNPNGCPISATFYVSHEWTDYSQVQNLYSDGHELASHTVSHSFGEQFSQKKWNREVSGQREILAAYGGVHLEDVRGMRAPFLSVGGNKMFKMLYDSNFTYDSSLPVYENRPPSWPYTLDYKLFHDCMIPPCPTRSYPGVWEVPMVMWQDLNGGRCSMGDACSNPSESDGVYKMLMKNFERHYTTNRAPFGLFYHAAWFTQPHHKEGFIKFLDFLVSKDDVYMLTNWQAIQWVRDPTPLNRIKNFPGFQCNYPDRPKRCNNPKVCNLWHKSGVRYMKTCQPCPDIYPWTGKTGIRSSRIDNDIED